MKTQTTSRMSTATREMANWLADRHGTMTEVIAVAVHNLYREEASQMEEKAQAVVEQAGGDVNECAAWLSDGDGDVMSVEEAVAEWEEVGATYQA